MFLILLRRELLANLMTFRFFVAILICPLLVTANSMVLIGDYERRLADYNTAVQIHRNAAVSPKVYSRLNVRVDRPPNPLSIFNGGMDKQLGNTVEIHYDFVPCLLDMELHGSDNPFLNLLASVDLVFIFQVVLSLLALLFAYDALAGERESGTLRLMLTNPISRSLVLLTKYVAAMTCLIVPFLISLVLAQLLITASGAIDLSGDDWLHIGGIVLTSIIYLSAFYLMGLLISTLSRRTATALMLSMFLWAILVLIYPSVSIWTVGEFWRPEEKLKAAYGEIEQIWKEPEKERNDYLQNHPVLRRGVWVIPLQTDYGWRVNSHSGHGRNDRMTLARHWTDRAEFIGIHETSPAQLVSDVKAYHQRLVPLWIRAAEKTWLVRQKALSEIYFRKAAIERSVMRFSPAGIYYLATAALTGTELHEMQNFMAQAQQYRQTIVAYLHDKKAFSSLQWFARSDDGKKAHEGGKVDWSDLPQFSYHRADMRTSLKHALPELALLLLINVLLFMGSFLIFARQEV